MPFPELDAFLTQHASAFRLAIIGGSRVDVPVTCSWIQAVLAPFVEDRTPVLVITGGMDGGVPGHAARIALRSCEFPILGVLPERGQRYEAPEFHDPKFDDVQRCLIRVPSIHGESAWTDASPLLVRLADAMLVIGGEWGTAVEVACAMKENDGRVRHGLPTIRMLPVVAQPGPASYLADASWIDVAIHAATFPPKPLRTPRDAVMYIRDLLVQPRHRP